VFHSYLSRSTPSWPLAVSLSFALSSGVAFGGGGALHIEPVRADLPQATPTAVAQTADGLLLVGTFGGLVRHDGVSTEVWDGWRSPVMSTVRVTSVGADPRGGAWVGSQYGHVWRFDGRQLNTVDSVPDGLGVVWDLASDGSRLWVAAQQGLYLRGDEGWIRHGERPAIDLAKGPQGQLAVVEEGRVRWLDPSGWVALSGDYRTATWADDGTLWLGGEEGVDRVVGGRATRFDPRPASHLVLREGEIWAARDAALWPVGGEAAVELPAPVRSLFADREGQLWVGTLGDGLLRIRRSAVQRVDVPAPTVVLPHPQGGMLVGSGCDGLRWVQPSGLVESFAEGACVRALRSIAGVVWVGHDATLSVLGDRGLQEVASVEEGGFVLAIGPQGRWLGARDGLVELRSHGLSTPRRQGAIPVVVAGRSPGEVWAGGPSSVGHFDGTTWRWLGHDDGVPRAQVRDLVFDGDDLWVATYGGGLARLRDGQFASVTTANGLHENVISRMLLDERGFAWLNGNRGVTRVALADLHMAADTGAQVGARLWRVGEGTGGSQPAGVVHDGEVWMPQLGHVSVFPSSELVAGGPAPEVRFLEATLDGADLLGPGPHVLPAGRGLLEVRFTAGALAEPELVRFQWRFPGEAWHDLGLRREAVWESVAAGPTVLEVRAANADGLWGRPARLTFERRAPWVSTIWFRVVLMGIVLLGAFALHRLRAASMAARNRQLEMLLSDRKRMEEELRRSELHYRSVFEAAGDGLIVVGEDGMVAQVNPAARAMFGQLVGSTWADRVAPGEGAWQVCHRDDRTTFRASVAELADARGRRLISVSDVSSLLDAEERERAREVGQAQAQRLEAIGRLAAGVAHDVNNLLGGLVGVSDALATEVEALDDPQEAHSLVRDLDACIDRGARLTQQLMAFGRQQPLAVQRLQLSRQLQLVQRLLEQAMPAGGELLVSCPEPAWVEVDAAQLDVALLNLVLNAVDAGARTVRIEVQNEDQTVCLQVLDDGEGMTGETMARATDPFYTTRPDGTGLGLPSVHGFLTQCGGELVLRSEVGKGSEITLRLPAARPPRKVDAPPAPDAALRVLLVDDDQQVLRAMSRMLRVAGMDCTAVSSAQEALTHDIGAYDVLVSDVRMPVMSGPELVEQVWQQRSDLPVVFVSGYADAPGELPARVVAKPFRAADLVQAIRQAAAQPSNVS